MARSGSSTSSPQSSSAALSMASSFSTTSSSSPTSSSSSNKTELKKFSSCHYYFMKYYNYYQYNPNAFTLIRRFVYFSIILSIIYVVYIVCMNLFPELDMIIHSKCYHPVAGWNGKLFSINIWETNFQTRPEIYNLHFAKNYDDIIVLPLSDVLTTHQKRPADPRISHELANTGHSDHFDSESIAISSSSSSKHFHQKRQNFSSIRQNKGDLRYLRTAVPPTNEIATDSPTNKIVLFGTHHKTGSYLAKKLFSKLCARFELCCQFHLTRDSLYSVYQTLNEEPVNILGHYQWIWYPYELNLASSGSASPGALNTATSNSKKLLTNYQQTPVLKSASRDYKFIHFYRHPFYKIISSYYYHYAGSEKWNTKFLTFHQICPTIQKLFDEHQIVQSTDPQKKSHDQCSHDLLNTGINSLPPEGCQYHSQTFIDRSLTFDYCETTYLCETCCRKEHEHTFSQDEYSATPSIDYSLLPALSQSLHSTRVLAKQNSNRTTLSQTGTYYHYQIRPLPEYQFICQYLGKKIPMNHTLQQVLQRSSLLEGLLIESALNYYEILRMAKIVNYTWNDENTFNLNLERLTQRYDPTIQEMLYHLQDVIQASWTTTKTHSNSFSSPTSIKALAKDLSFYDLHDSFLYRWSMSNPLHNHITNEQAHHRYDDVHEGGRTYSKKKILSRRDLFEFLANHPIVSKMYAPILQLLSAALT